ncbi:MAG: saccharopine dehydrogenase [Spirochaetae bacterium HGW-Spirochaetae-7]|jgi:saccharopine dehydrogenase-like NADP-dependent oxidoreductase|nr:MAG: saccharopine dehydrogenase [Spirochaetae bacterium HGW-Spirochaetae-7]
MSGKRVVQLGYGMQGKASLVDLMSALGIAEIIVADSLPDTPETIRALGDPRVKGIRVDASKGVELAAVMRGADVVVELLPGLFALPVARLAAELGVNLVSAMYLANPGEQNPSKREAERLELEKINSVMKAKGKTILEEFGMDPGIDLVIGRKALNALDEVHAFHSYGAGFPELSSANNPIRYKFTWSVLGVMRSYLRPAVVIKGGKDIAVPADEMFSPANMHILDVPEMGGPLECFLNGDSSHFAESFGIRKTVKNMGRYICRWPGHAAFWGTMAKSGFLSDEPIIAGDAKVAPSVFCAALLGSQDQFFYGDGERDLALIRADARGLKNGRPTRVIYQIVDRRDLRTGLTAMQRTVGFPVSIGAQMILDGRISKKGIMSPSDVDFDGFMEELGKRGITMSWNESVWDGKLEA